MIKILFHNHKVSSQKKKKNEKTLLYRGHRVITG